jgi:hypothetical protein
VVKAVKKRNRHLKERFGKAASTSLTALDMLGHEVFFTSPRLAHLATQVRRRCAALCDPNLRSQQTPPVPATP